MTNFEDKDMGYVRDFVAKIAEALVAATELPKQMNDIKISMDILSSDLERTKSRNIELDTLLNDTRRQRDEAEQALSQAKSELSQVTSQKDFAEQQATSFQAQIASLQDGLSSVKKERDDYGLKHMAAEDRANEAEAKLAALRKAAGWDVPEPKAEVALSQSTPLPATEPTQPKRVYEGESNYWEQSQGKVERYEQGRGYYVEV